MPNEKAQIKEYTFTDGLSVDDDISTTSEKYRRQVTSELHRYYRLLTFG